MLVKAKVNKKLWVVIGVVILVVAFGAVRLFAKAKPQVAGTQTSNTSIASESSNAKATAEVGKTFDFTAINVNKVQKPVKFTILKVERKDQIMVQGEVQVAPKGADYLLVRLEIENPHTERLAIAPSDLVRLEDSGKFFAPDYHNGNVVLDPISTKKELIAFVVKQDANNFSFQVGQLDGDKQKVEISY